MVLGILPLVVYILTFYFSLPELYELRSLLENSHIIVFRSMGSVHKKMMFIDCLMQKYYHDFISTFQLHSDSSQTSSLLQTLS